MSSGNQHNQDWNPSDPSRYFPSPSNPLFADQSVFGGFAPQHTAMDTRNAYPDYSQYKDTTAQPSEPSASPQSWAADDRSPRSKRRGTPTVEESSPLNETQEQRKRRRKGEKEREQDLHSSDLYSKDYGTNPALSYQDPTNARQQMPDVLPDDSDTWSKYQRGLTPQPPTYQTSDSGGGGSPSHAGAWADPSRTQFPTVLTENDFDDSALSATFPHPEQYTPDQRWGS